MKYIIHCKYGSPLSSWSEPATEEEILDRYYEQLIDQTDENIKREDFTRELFEDIYECYMEEVNEN